MNQEVKDTIYYNKQNPSAISYDPDKMRLPFLYEADRRKFKTAYGSMLDPRIVDTIGVFLENLGPQTYIARDRLVAALLSRDAYASVQESYKAGTIDDVMYLVDSLGAAGGCLQNADEAINITSNSWEISAQITRSFFGLSLPMRGSGMGLSNLLNEVYNDPRFAHLINHTEFRVSRNGRRRYFKGGSVLRRLKDYRNSSVHLLGLTNEFMVKAILSSGTSPLRRTEIRLYDHMSNGYESVNIPDPEELVQLAEDGYGHFAEGFRIIEDVILDDLRSKGFVFS